MKAEDIAKALAELQNLIVSAHCAVHSVSMDGSHYFKTKDAIDAAYKLMQKYGPLTNWFIDNNEKE